MTMALIYKLFILLFSLLVSISTFSKVDIYVYIKKQQKLIIIVSSISGIRWIRERGGKKRSAATTWCHHLVNDTKKTT